MLRVLILLGQVSDMTYAQYREAYEEVGLPMNHPDIHTLSVLQPFVSWTRLLVTPVVALLTNLELLNHLTPSEGEVDVIFDHPFEAILDPHLSAQENLVGINSELWPAEEEFYVCICICTLQVSTETQALSF